MLFIDQIDKKMSGPYYIDVGADPSSIRGPVVSIEIVNRKLMPAVSLEDNISEKMAGSC
jgi:hypothetical protein